MRWVVSIRAGSRYMPKRGDEHPDKPGWRWSGKDWISPEAWVRQCIREAGRSMAEREWKRLYYVPKRVPKGPPFHGDEHSDRPGWRWSGKDWRSPEAWARYRLRVAGKDMASREYDRLYEKQWDDRYGSRRVINTLERKAYSREHTKLNQELAGNLLEKQGHRCAYCGCSIGYGLEHTSTPAFDRIDVDGGALYTEDTTQALCRSCNGLKLDIAEVKLLDMTNVSSLVKHNIRRYLDGAPRIFEEKEDDNISIRHRGGRAAPGADDNLAANDSGGER